MSKDYDLLDVLADFDWITPLTDLFKSTFNQCYRVQLTGYPEVPSGLMDFWTIISGMWFESGWTVAKFKRLCKKEGLDTFYWVLPEYPDEFCIYQKDFQKWDRIATHYGFRYNRWDF